MVEGLIHPGDINAMHVNVTKNRGPKYTNQRLIEEHGEAGNYHPQQCLLHDGGAARARSAEMQSRGAD